MKQTIFEIIGRVKEVYDTAEVNNLISEGWVLLNVAQHHSSDSAAYDHCYSLGQIDESRIVD